MKKYDLYRGFVGSLVVYSFEHVSLKVPSSIPGQTQYFSIFFPTVEMVISSGANFRGSLSLIICQSRIRYHYHVNCSAKPSKTNLPKKFRGLNFLGFSIQK